MEQQRRALDRLPQGRPWVVVGSGPATSPAMIQRALDDHPGAVLATCNAGVRLCGEAADVVWLSDSRAVAQWLGDFQRVRKPGALLATNTYAGPEVREVADVVVYIPPGRPAHYTPGEVHNGRTSGGMLIQCALACGAPAVAMVGIQGYRSGADGQQVDYYDGRKGLSDHDVIMADHYGPMVQSAIDQSPGVLFTFYGVPSYAWAGPNVQEVARPGSPVSPRERERIGQPSGANTRRWAIAVPGPPLASIDGAEVLARGYRHVVAVNRAIEWRAGGRRVADIWAALDVQAFEQWGRGLLDDEAAGSAPATIIATDQNVIGRARTRPGGELVRELLSQERRRIFSTDVAIGLEHRFGRSAHRPKGWEPFSDTFALAVAVAGGATGVDVYGMALAGNADFTGATVEVGRHGERWSVQRTHWSRLREWAHAMGVALTFTPDPFAVD